MNSLYEDSVRRADGPESSSSSQRDFLPIKQRSGSSSGSNASTGGSSAGSCVLNLLIYRMLSVFISLIVNLDLYVSVLAKSTHLSYLHWSSSTSLVFILCF